MVLADDDALEELVAGEGGKVCSHPLFLPIQCLEKLNLVILLRFLLVTLLLRYSLFFLERVIQFFELFLSCHALALQLELLSAYQKIVQLVYVQSFRPALLLRMLPGLIIVLAPI